MKRVLYLALLPALFLACSKEADQSPQGRFDRAMKQVDRLEFIQAESTFVQLQRADSVSPLGDLGLAQTYEQKLWWLDGLSYYLRLAEKHPDLATAAGGAVRGFYNLGSYYDASRAAEKWVSLDPQGVEPHYWQALAFIRLMDLAGASNALKTAEENDLDKGAARLIEARIQWLRNSFDASVATAAQGISSGSKAPEYFCALSDYYAERGIPDSAVWAAQQGYAAQANAYSAWQCLEVCSRHHYYWAARQLLRDWDNRDNEKSVSAILHFRYSLASDDKFASSLLADRFQEAAPNAYTTLVYSALANRSLYNELVSADFFDQAIYVAAGSQAESFKEYFGAYVGYSYARSYNRDGAATQLQAVKGWRTETTEFQAIIYSQMTISGGRPLADKMLDSLLPARGWDPVWLTAIADAYANAKGAPFSMGKRFYQMALEQAPSYRPAFVGLVRLAVATEQYQEAIAAFDGFSQYGPMSPELANLKAVSLVRVGRIDEGIALFKQTFTQCPHDIEAARNLVRALAAKRLRDQIRELALFCVTTAKDNPDAYELAARALLDWGFAEEGLQVARRGLEVESENLHLRTQEARGLYALGQRSDAKMVFEDVLSKESSPGETILYYSLVLAESKEDTLRAELMAQRALVLVSPELFPAKNLSRVYLTLGRYTSSRQACLRAAVISPEDPEVWYLMGMCQFNEKLPEARENLQKAVSLGLVGDDLRKAQEALRQL